MCYSHFECHVMMSIVLTNMLTMALTPHSQTTFMTTFITLLLCISISSLYIHIHTKSNHISLTKLHEHGLEAKLNQTTIKFLSFSSLQWILYEP